MSQASWQRLVRQEADVEVEEDSAVFCLRASWQRLVCQEVDGLEGVKVEEVARASSSQTAPEDF